VYVIGLYVIGGVLWIRSHPRLGSILREGSWRALSFSQQVLSIFCFGVLIADVVLVCVLLIYFSFEFATIS
jgi:hypothetical protein